MDHFSNSNLKNIVKRDIQMSMEKEKYCIQYLSQYIHVRCIFCNYGYKNKLFR